MVKLQVSKTLQGKIRKGYPWVFHYQIQNKNVSGSAGDLGVIYDSQNRFLAIGLFDPQSDIRFRVLHTGSPVEINPQFFRDRLREAFSLRASLEGEGTTGYRLINGENDGFPGLILDRYEDTVVLKLYTLSWQPYLDMLTLLIKERKEFKRCILRVNRKVHKICGPGNPLQEGRILFGAPLEGPVSFRENDIRFEADVLRGNKTGFFLDQRENRRQIGKLAQNRTVLNVFSYTGAFSVYAFAGGCRSVTEIDTNAHALSHSLETLKRNFPGQLFNPPRFIQLRGDAFVRLEELRKEQKVFDLVILDPPAFASNRKQKANALNAYRRLAEAGAHCTAREGLLFAASCSAHIEEAEFFNAVADGLQGSESGWETKTTTGHAIDHPVRFQGGAYLKGILLKRKK